MKSIRRVSSIAWSFAAACALGLAAPAYSSTVSLSGNYLAGRYAGRKRDNVAAADFFARALRLDPKNPVILEDAFQLEVSAGRIDRAQRLARRLVKRNPKHRFAHLVLGLADFRAGRFKRARKHFESGNAEPIAQLAARLLIGWSHLASGSPKKALKSLEKLTGTASFEIFKAYHSALIADLGGLEKQARSNFENAKQRAGTSLRVVQAYGSFLERRGEAEKARALYKKYAESAPNNPLINLAEKAAGNGQVSPRLIASADTGAAEALFGIASALADETGIDLALRYMQLALYMRPDFPVGQMLLGNIFEDIKDYERAVATYERVSAKSKLRRNAELQIAENLDRMEKTDEAIEFLEKVNRRRPKDIRPYMLLGNILRARSRFAEAVEAYSGAVERLGKPKQSDWTLFYFRGISYERTKVWPKAEADFKKSLELNPDQPSVLNYLGYSWVEKRLNFKEALEMIRKAVELRPNDGYIVDSLGWAHYQLGGYEKAVKSLERAVLLRPEDPVINDHLGDAYWRVGRKREARFQWTHARDLKPEEKELEKIERKIKLGLVEAEKKVVASADPASAAASAKPPKPAAQEPVTEKPAEAEKPGGQDVAKAEPAAKAPEPETESVKDATRLHEIKPGETLWSISQRYYGKGDEFGRLIRANEGIADPNVIFPGQKLVVPDAD